MTDTDLIIKYVRLNLSTVKSMLTRPNALKDIIKKLKLEMPKGELADLIGPLIIQRAQGTLQESGLKKGIDAVLDSMPAKKEEEKFQQDQLRGKPMVDIKIGAVIPYSLSGFKDDRTNQLAAELYDKYSRQFSVGQAIAMTRRDLNRTDLDLTPAPPPVREVPKMPESKPVHHPVEHPSLFSRDEIKYASATISPMQSSQKELNEVCEAAYEAFKDTIDWSKEELMRYLETWTWIKASWVAKDNGRVVGGYCINDQQLRLPQFPQLKGMRGLQGLALFVLPEYRGTGLGRQLREKIKSTNPDYVWGEHLESLNNLDKWVSYGREHVGTVNGVHITLQILKDQKTASDDGIRTENGTPIRRSTLGVGKDIGGAIYLHRQYADQLPDQDGLKAAEQALPPEFNWNVVKATKDGNYTFFNSPDFDSAPEPVGGDYILVSRTGWTKEGHTNSIWHHKWLWVKDDYQGFDVAASKARSKQWTALPGIDYNRIGNKSFWEQNVVPKLHTAAGYYDEDEDEQPSNKPFVYVTCCVDANGDDINDMVDRARDVSLNTLKKYCDISAWERANGYGRDLKLNKDWAVSFHKSVYRGVPCFYIRHSAIEYVWVRRSDYSKAAAIAKTAFVAHVPGHLNSKGEPAPWVVKSHETGKILSSHKSEAAAKEHLRQMHIHKG